jgi:hypothetical protein
MSEGRPGFGVGSLSLIDLEFDDRGSYPRDSALDGLGDERDVANRSGRFGATRRDAAVRA